MAEWLEQAIIMRSGHFREADIWLRALLKSRGMFTLFAFGGAKSRRRFCGCLDQFNTLDCRIRVSRGGEYLSLEEAALRSAPLKLRNDWRGMGIATNCLRFAEACGIGPEAAPECFAIMEDLRERMEKPGPVPGFMPQFFRLRLAGAIGYRPDFTVCSACGREIGTWGCFQVAEGRTFCHACSPGLSQAQPGIRLGRPALDLLLDVQHNLPRSWPEGAASEDLRQAVRAIDGFVQYHLGLEWDNGTFRRI